MRIHEILYTYEVFLNSVWHKINVQNMLEVITSFVFFLKHCATLRILRKVGYAPLVCVGHYSRLGHCSISVKVLKVAIW